MANRPIRIFPTVCPCPCRHYVYAPQKWIRLLVILSPGKGGGNIEPFALTNTQIAQRLRITYRRAGELIHAAFVRRMIKRCGYGLWTKTMNGHLCLSAWKRAGWKP